MKKYVIKKNNTIYYIAQDELCNNSIVWYIATFEGKVVDEILVSSNRKNIIEKELNKIGYKLIGELY